MKRLILSLAAALLVAGPLASSEALAKDKRGGWDQPRGGGDRGHSNRGGNGNGRWRNEDRPAPRQNWERPRREDDGRRAGDYGVRRGGYMPREAAPPVIENPARHRLRTPPRGYNWVRVPDGYALIDERTGQIFDMVPVR